MKNMTYCSLFVRKPPHARVPSLRALGDYCASSIMDFMHIQPSELAFMYAQTAAVLQMDFLSFSRRAWKADFDAHLERAFALRGFDPRLRQGLTRLNDVALFGTWTDLKRVVKAVAAGALSLADGLLNLDLEAQYSNIFKIADASTPASQNDLDFSPKTTNNSDNDLTVGLELKSAVKIFDIFGRKFSDNVATIFASEIAWQKFTHFLPFGSSFQDFPDITAKLLAYRLLRSLSESHGPKPSTLSHDLPMSFFGKRDEIVNFLDKLSSKTNTYSSEVSIADRKASLLTKILASLVKVRIIYPQVQVSLESARVLLLWVAGESVIPERQVTPSQIEREFLAIVRLSGLMCKAWERHWSRLCQEDTYVDAWSDGPFLEDLCDLKPLGFGAKTSGIITNFVIPVFDFVRIQYPTTKRWLLRHNAHLEGSFSLDELMCSTGASLLQKVQEVVEARGSEAARSELATFLKVGRALVAFLRGRKDLPPTCYRDYASLAFCLQPPDHADSSGIQSLCARLDQIGLLKMTGRFRKATLDAGRSQIRHWRAVQWQFVKLMLDTVYDHPNFQHHALFNELRQTIGNKLGLHIPRERTVGETLRRTIVTHSNQEDLRALYRTLALRNKIRYKQSRAWLKRAEREVRTWRDPDVPFTTFQEVKCYAWNLGLNLTTPELVAILGLHTWPGEGRDFDWRLTPSGFLQAYRGWLVRQRHYEDGRQLILDVLAFLLVMIVVMILLYAMDLVGAATSEIGWSIMVVLKAAIYLLVYFSFEIILDRSSFTE
jgi:hypothetical protein